MKYATRQSLICPALLFTTTFMAVAASAGDRLAGRVEGSGVPIAKADVSLWVTTSNASRKLAETQTTDDGSFEFTTAGEKDNAGVLYVVAEGGVAKVGAGTKPNPAITLMVTLGTEPPERVTINELTTVASAWTGAQFLNGSALSGNALGYGSPPTTCRTSWISKPAAWGRSSWTP